MGFIYLNLSGLTVYLTNWNLCTLHCKWRQAVNTHHYESVFTAVEPNSVSLVWQMAANRRHTPLRHTVLCVQFAPRVRVVHDPAVGPPSLTPSASRRSARCLTSARHCTRRSSRAHDGVCARATREWRRTPRPSHKHRPLGVRCSRRSSVRRLSRHRQASLSLEIEERHAAARARALQAIRTKSVKAFALSGGPCQGKKARTSAADQARGFVFSALSERPSRRRNGESDRARCCFDIRRDDFEYRAFSCVVIPLLPRSRSPAPVPKCARPSIRRSHARSLVRNDLNESNEPHMA